MTEFQDIDDFVKELETPEFTALIDTKLVMRINIDELDDDFTREDAKERAVKKFNEAEFDKTDILINQTKGRKVDFE